MGRLVGFVGEGVLGCGMGVVVEGWNGKMVMIGGDVMIGCGGVVVRVIWV